MTAHVASHMTPPAAQSLQAPGADSAHAMTPRHVGFILDGNRRWAKARGLQPCQGHCAGARVVLECVQWCESRGIEVVSMWLLSTDNVARPQRELEGLYRVISQLVQSIVDMGFEVRVLGAHDLLPAELASQLERVGSNAPVTRRLLVNLAVGYGGRSDILAAMRALMREAGERGETPAELAQSLSEEMIDNHLATAGQPHPDVLIRTSGEQRLSGFLLWQSVYSELIFTDVLWPDFSEADLDAALAEFSGRERRFGA